MTFLMAEPGFPNGKSELVTTDLARAVACRVAPSGPRSNSGCQTRNSAAIPRSSTAGSVLTVRFAGKQLECPLSSPWKWAGSGGCDKSPPQEPLCQQGSHQTELRISNSPNANLRSTKHFPLCPQTASRSDLIVQSSGNRTHRQKTDCDVTRSRPFVGVQRTLRFSRFDSRRKVFSEHEKRNADQCSPTGGKPNCHR